jgi:uncharacterized protein (TIGR02246 family)
MTDDAPLAPTAELVARLRRLEDLQEIQQLFVDYGAFLDAGDLDGYASLFAADGELLLGPVGRATGPEAIKELMGRATASSVGNSFHVISSPQVQLDGDRATSVVMWTVVAKGPDGSPTVTMIGKHKDVLTRTPAGWRFQRREGHIDIPTVMRG